MRLLLLEMGKGKEIQTRWMDDAMSELEEERRRSEEERVGIEMVVDEWDGTLLGSRCFQELFPIVSSLSLKQLCWPPLLIEHTP